MPKKPRRIADGSFVVPQIIDAWKGLSLRRRIITVAATVAMFAAVLGLARLSGQERMALLYSGLDPTESGAVIRALDAQGARYEVQGTAIYVPASQRDMLRMNLASDGLPSPGGQGYELLDSLSGFGTTAQMFDAAYWRAREGELARTLLANPNVRAARVHISIAAAQPFARDRKPSASVAITTASAPVSADLARAARTLVAAAVPGMQPDGVSVINSRTGKVVGDNADADASTRAEALRRHVARLLEARVGPGRAVVEVAVDVNHHRESLVQRQIDPASRVQISTETEERSNTAKDTGGGGVTVASNLPSGAGAGNSSSQSQGTQTRERVNYDVSETRRETVSEPGGIARLSVAVLVDGIRTTAADGTQTWAPRSDAELAALHDLVASAVGYDKARGDTVTIKTMEFQPLPTDGTLAQGGQGGMIFSIETLAAIGALALVALVLGMFVVRPALKARPGALPAPNGGAGQASGATGESGDAPALDGEIDDGIDPLPDLNLPALSSGFMTMSGGEDDPVARLRRLIDERRDETVEILRSWMEEPEATE